MLSLLVAMLIAQAPPPRPAEATTKPLAARWQARPGERAEVNADGVLATTSEGEYYDLHRFLQAGDLVGIRKQLEAGDALPLDRGTVVLIVSIEDQHRTGSPIEVRIRSGRFADEKVFVHEKNLGRVSPPPKAPPQPSTHVRRRQAKRRRASAAIDALSRPLVTEPADPFGGP